MALPIIRLAVSPTPIGLTPGHLSRAIRRQATRAETPLGSTCWEQSFLAVAASASQSSVEAVLKDEHSLSRWLHPCLRGLLLRPSSGPYYELAVHLFFRIEWGVVRRLVVVVCLGRLGMLAWLAVEEGGLPGEFLALFWVCHSLPNNAHSSVCNCFYNHILTSYMNLNSSC